MLAEMKALLFNLRRDIEVNSLLKNGRKAMKCMEKRSRGTHY